MFGKLMKYELKATSKWYLIVAGGCLVREHLLYPITPK